MSWLGFVTPGMMGLEQKIRVSGEYFAVLEHVWTEDIVQGQDQLVEILWIPDFLIQLIQSAQNNEHFCLGFPFFEQSQLQLSSRGCGGKEILQFVVF